MICGIWLASSCNKESSPESALFIKSVSSTGDARSTTIEPDLRNDTIMWCTGNDIEWYNATTEELRLSKAIELPISWPWRQIHLVVFLQDKKLLSFEAHNGLSSISTAYPCITSEWDGESLYKGCKCGNKQDHIPGENCEPVWEHSVVHYYISKGYPRWDPKDRDEKTAHWDWASIDEVRDRNWKAIENEWNIFIEQLKEEGKYRK